MRATATRRDRAPLHTSHSFDATLSRHRRPDTWRPPATLRIATRPSRTLPTTGVKAAGLLRGVTYPSQARNVAGPLVNRLCAYQADVSKTRRPNFKPTNGSSRAHAARL